MGTKCGLLQEYKVDLTFTITLYNLSCQWNKEHTYGNLDKWRKMDLTKSQHLFIFKTLPQLVRNGKELIQHVKGYLKKKHIN